MNSDDIKNYTARKFSIDCPKMVLRQNTKARDRIYEGPGSVYQTAEGDLMFKLYASSEGDRIVNFFRVFEKPPGKAGEIIPREECYSLEATAMNGDVWHSEFILPEFNQGVTRELVVVGSLHELTDAKSDPHSKGQAAGLSLRFADDFEFPGNAPIVTKTYLKGVETGMSGDWTPAVFKAAGIEFQLLRSHGTVFLSAQSTDQALPPRLDSRICEALQFTFFEPKPWIIRTISEDGQITTTLRPFPKQQTKKAFRQPIDFRSRLFGEHVWNLFGKYLEHVITYVGPEWHPLSYSVYSAIVGDASLLDAGLLALSVAIEGVLKTGFPQLAVPDEFFSSQIDAASTLISQSSLPDSLKRRIAGSLNSMRASRAKDKLLILREAGVIRQELIKAWEQIRHPSVHGDGFDRANLQKSYRDYQAALTLFNELVFLIIGYRGQYTDYSVVGWPPRNYEKTMKDADCSAGQSVLINEAVPPNGIPDPPEGN